MTIPARGPQTLFFLPARLAQRSGPKAIFGSVIGLGKSRQVGGDRKSWNPGYWQLGYVPGLGYLGSGTPATGNPGLQCYLRLGLARQV